MYVVFVKIHLSFVCFLAYAGTRACVYVKVERVYVNFRKYGIQPTFHMWKTHRLLCTDNSLYRDLYLNVKNKIRAEYFTLELRRIIFMETEIRYVLFQAIWGNVFPFLKSCDFILLKLQVQWCILYMVNFNGEAMQHYILSILYIQYYII